MGVKCAFAVCGFPHGALSELRVAVMGLIGCDGGDLANALCGFVALFTFTYFSNCIKVTE